MKKVISSFALVLCAFTSAHASKASDYSSAVGVQVIARTVLEKKLLSRYAQKVLELALETDKVELGKMECSRKADVDHCWIEVFVLDDETTEEAEETVYLLDVQLRKGEVISASWNIIAG